ncbi:hypothetical protein [Magnetospirillum sp. 64-120]|uniref:hypothetical protein n=1 Tax=Magnetospirillum sp. 64-120 TaxID=1895778 RepID=UPI0025C2D5FE|nr:hypothetical protein [Magnetospirillum sp. 64-120]
MDLMAINALIEQLRRETIGAPQWVPAKGVFEYREQSPIVVAVLKLVRAAHGVNAVEILCASGLFIDAGAIMRCIGDCCDEIHFLLEGHPAASEHVLRFVKAFFETTIDGGIDDCTPNVPVKKIRGAVVRVLKGRHDDETQKTMERIHKTFSGYIHANYAHVMEIYNGGKDDFNLAGVPSQSLRAERMQYVDVARTSVVLAAAFIAQMLTLHELHGKFVELLDEA